MFSFLQQNLSTIIISLILLAIVAGIIIKLTRDHKKGKSVGCGCGCGNCPNSSACHGGTLHKPS